MKTILEFDMPTDEEDLMYAQSGKSYFCAIWEIKQYLFNQVDEVQISEEKREIYEDILKRLNEELDDRDVLNHF